MPNPLASTVYPALPPISGVRLATASCGIRYKNRPDVLLTELAEDTVVAGVFTRSLTASAPVIACRKALKNRRARALIVNSGNANAFTGSVGEASVKRIAGTCAKALGCPVSAVFTASTGIIGERLPDEKITSILRQAAGALSDTAWHDAARAIMTTDTYPKMATRKVKIGKTVVIINGIAKGSGMIAPDMATMLAFVFTDAKIPARFLQKMLTEANETTFNCITVDGDTSTSDTLLLFATGKAKNPAGNYAGFKCALREVLHELALHVVRDGEGAEKLITISVTGAASDKAAKKIGMSIGNSPLVKTALAAGDANWGRIVMAVGKAGEKANRDKLVIKIGGVTVAQRGAAHPTYRESQIEAHMKGRDIRISVDVGIGKGKATVYTCDLTHRYIDINGSYRT
ncbi:MAG: bifunctional glutamate N-acetyltransferase/amino-acid acetyltransferase ArgJ [Pseudomonadota bacterium]|nr:bifunctional glutamate N-acetyltransferase/amino-acid acetyltransferase ArgJ [Pseudomonadota bacterium]MDE3038399.1 bifunctional glutamate N-acetyltransferase/amino-acid acetyltransferase ArgJ [Pseudomonadota bacterium]